jgi:hypothetical protein
MQRCIFPFQQRGKAAIKWGTLEKVGELAGDRRCAACGARKLPGCATVSSRDVWLIQIHSEYQFILERFLGAKKAIKTGG